MYRIFPRLLIPFFLALTAVQAAGNLVRNADFERGSLKEWHWGVNNGAVAKAVVDTAESHSRGHALKLTNQSPRTPHVFGALRQRVAGLKPETRYTLSAWVKASKTDRGWIGGGAGWKIRLPYPAGTYDWQRISTTFETGADTGFDLVIVTEGPTTALWVDDISIQEVRAEPASVTGGLLRNAGFEDGSLQAWNWGVNRKALAKAGIDTAESHSGAYSLKIENRSDQAPHVYGVLRQRVSDIKPNTRYTLGAWVKATGAYRGWMGGGPDWKLRLRYPSGTYDWQWITTTFVTGDYTEFEFVIVTEGPTESLWIDDISLQETETVGAVKTSQLFPSVTSDGMPAGARFYPLFPAGPTVTPPVVRIRSKESPVFGADVALTTSPAGLFFSIDVSDPSPFRTSQGEAMWNGDSIQIAIDSRGATGDLGNTNTYYEIGFSWPGHGPVSTHAWVGNFNWAGVVAEGAKTAEGYRISGTIPWGSLSLDPSHLPRDIGINIVVNDVGPEGRRRFVEWTPATARVKNAALFARAMFVPAGQRWAQAVFPGADTYDRGQSVTGRIIEYALDDVAASELVFDWTRRDGESSADASPPAVCLPALGSDQARVTHFDLPPANFADEGLYTIDARWRTAPQTAVTRRALASFTRADLATRIATELAGAKRRLENARLHGGADSEMSPYARLGLKVATRFVERVERLSADPEIQPWSLMQLDELKEVFAAIESAPLPSRPLAPVPSRVVIGEGGAFADADTARPFYFYGYGHFNRAYQDIPLLSDLGATLIQQEKGPSSLDADNRIVSGTARFMRDLLKKADQADMKVDFLLSPHYMPARVLEQFPEARLANASGFGKYNIDHPATREVISRWISEALPILKNSSALLSVCLANEPIYAHSGRDPWSRPAWVEYLRTTHGSVDKLNTIYGTAHRDFEAVPLPGPVRPEGLSEQRAWYDWIRFNQQHLAAWIGWLDSQVKEVAPEVFTHAKVMANIFKRSYLAQGTDPELICAVTDLAGNDAWAYHGVSSRYAYDWQSSQMWYDLLHSFRGQPVYNSENHFIRDSAPPVSIPSAHTRSILWQGAIHHMGATAMWVWDEPRDHDVSGNISLRPANTYAAGRTMLDLRRLAPEVSALAKAPAKVALLYSVPSIFWNESYTPAATATYTALMFAGEPVTFISERQLAAGERSVVNAAATTLILTQATHVSDEILRGLSAFVEGGGKILAIGEANLGHDEYGRPRRVESALADRIVTLPMPAGGSGQVDVAREISRVLRPHLDRSAAGLLVDAASGEPAWGVEHRLTPFENGHLLTMTNLLPHAVEVRFDTGLADQAEVVDLFTERPASLSRLMLDPMEPRLFFLKPVSRGL